MKKTVKGILSAILAFSLAGTVNVSAEKSEIIYGDANCDSAVDVRDMTAIKQHIVQLSELSEKGIENCDFFGDGLITVKNLGQMSKYLVKLIDKLEPVSEGSYIPEASVIFTSSKAESEFKVYETAEELRKDISPVNLELAGSDEKFFSENVLFVYNICVHPSAKTEMESVEKDKTGNFIFNVVQKFSTPEHTGEIVVGYSVCMALPKSEYTGQTASVNMSETYIKTEPIKIYL